MFLVPVTVNHLMTLLSISSSRWLFNYVSGTLPDTLIHVIW